MTSAGTPALMHQVRQRYGAGLGSFMAWWKQSLLAWLPLRWRTFLGLARERLLLCRVGGQWLLQLEHAAGLEEVALLPSGVDRAGLDAMLGKRTVDLPRWLLLPAAGVLRRQLLLPAAAAERLREVVGFEIDRQTPFNANAVRFDARVLRRRADGQLEVELVAVPLAAFEPAVAELGTLAGSLAGVDAMDQAGQPLGVNLLPVAQRRQRVDPLRRWNRILALAALLALLLAAWQVLDNRRAAAAAFALEVEARAAQARGVAVQRQQLQDLVEGAAFLDQARASRPTTVEVLEELSRRVPDGTYLEKVSIEGRQLLLIGFSPEAAGLVGNLQASPLWRSPALSGALQPDPRLGLDRFSLVAELVEGSPAAPAEVADGASPP